MEYILQINMKIGSYVRDTKGLGIRGRVVGGLIGWYLLDTGNWLNADFAEIDLDHYWYKFYQSI